MCIVCEVKKAGATGAALDIVEQFARSVAEVLRHSKRIEKQDLTQFGKEGRAALNECERILTAADKPQGLRVQVIPLDSEEGEEIVKALQAAGIEIPQPTKIH